MSGEATNEEPLLRVVSGEPTDEELTALVTVLAACTAASANAAGTPDRPRSAWGDPVRGLRQRLVHGPGRWRSSALPR